MAKSTKNTSTKDGQIVHLKNANAALQEDLKNVRSDLKKARAEAARHKTNAAKAKEKSDEVIAKAKDSAKYALSEFGPSVLVELQRESTTADASVLNKGTVIGVLHIHDKINTDYLVSAIQTGRARVVPGITDGVFQMADLIALRDRNAELEGAIAELTKPPKEDAEKDGGGS